MNKHPTDAQRKYQDTPRWYQNDQGPSGGQGTDEGYGAKAFATGNAHAFEDTLRPLPGSQAATLRIQSNAPGPA